jgi:hypothetical protein
MAAWRPGQARPPFLFAHDLPAMLLAHFFRDVRLGEPDEFRKGATGRCRRITVY